MNLRSAVPLAAARGFAEHCKAQLIFQNWPKRRVPTLGKAMPSIAKQSIAKGMRTGLASALEACRGWEE